MRPLMTTWAATILCAVISVMSLIGTIGAGGYVTAPFFAFLPVCFAFIAFRIMQVEQQIQRLSERIDSLQQNGGDSREQNISRHTEEKVQFSLAWLMFVMLMIGLALAEGIALFKLSQTAMTPRSFVIPSSGNAASK